MDSGPVAPTETVVPTSSAEQNLLCSKLSPGVCPSSRRPQPANGRIVPKARFQGAECRALLGGSWAVMQEAPPWERPSPPDGPWRPGLLGGWQRLEAAAEPPSALGATSQVGAWALGAIWSPAKGTESAPGAAPRSPC